MIEVEWDDNLYLDCYWPVVRTDYDVKMYWGGRDSGKSYNIALELIEKCLSAKKFKCILIRKTFESIRGSQFDLLQMIVNDLGLGELFKFTKTPLEIVCFNGNRFIARGCDAPHNIKSVTEPTDAWYEEADKITYEEYSVVSTSLRSGDVRVQEWLSFNPESLGDYTESWLYKLVGEHYNQIHEFTRNIEVDGNEVEINYVSVHTTFNDNPYCPPERKAKNISTTENNNYLYNVYIHGKWGNREIKSPYLYNFDKTRHIGNVEADHRFPIIFSLDFNVDPFACEILQIYRDNEGHKVRFLDEITIFDGDVFKMAERIKSKLTPLQLANAIFTGDAMQRKREISQRDNLDAWTILKRELRISDARLRVPKSNPIVRENKHLCNFILSIHKDFKIDPKCKNLINDCQMVESDEEGNIMKKNRNKEEQRADHLDCFRYALNTFMPDFIVKTAKYL